jgi:hypothetical protein
MKTIIKLTALALIAAFAVITCSPEAELSDVDWKAVNADKNATKNTAVVQPKSSDFSFSAVATAETTTDTITLKKNEFTFSAPANSDFLRSGGKVDIAALQKFLSFHYFTVADPFDGEADTLDEALLYSYIRRVDNVVILKLESDPVPPTRIIAKIDGTKYTFAGGNKIDKASRGKTGEAGYDDFYYSLTGTGTAFFEPGNKGWYLTLSSISGGSGSGQASNETSRVIASLSFPSSTRVSDTIKDEVFQQLKEGLRIEYLNNNNQWTPYSSSGPGITMAVNGDISIATLSRGDLVPFRVIWKGNAPFATTKAYFGVKQWIKILGANTGNVVTTTQHDYYMNTVYGSVGAPWYTNESPYRFLVPTIVLYTPPAWQTQYAAPRVNLFSCDSNGQNVVIDVVFARLPTYGTVTINTGLLDLSSNVTLFKNNFKIAYYNTSAVTPAEFEKRTDVVYIDIKEYKYLNGSAPQQGLDTIRVTLDPSYRIDSSKNMFLYLSPEICYADTLKSGFGSIDNWQYGFFRAYGFRMLLPLTENVWANGNLNLGTNEVWYSLPTGPSGTYYVWWNDKLQGDGTKTADVTVGMRYAGQNWYVEYGDDGWETSSPLSVNPNAIVEIRVIPKNLSNANIGTYSIAYSTTNTRP